MLSIRPRGKNKTWHVDLCIAGRGHVVRGSLGTSSKDAAQRLKHKLDNALSEGPKSTLWPELAPILPQATFQCFAKLVGVKANDFTLDDLIRSYEARAEFRINIGKLQPSSLTRYKRTLTKFSAFLAERKIFLLRDCDKPLLEDFKTWRLTKMREGSGRGIIVELKDLHAVFAHAVDNDMIAKNPVRTESAAGENPPGGADSYSEDELNRLREHVEGDTLPFLLLRWTGFRVSDAAAVSFQEIDFDRDLVDRVTLKRGKRVILNLHGELMAVLRAERDRRNPKPTEPVLLNPNTGKLFKPGCLRDHIVALGGRAGVHAYPHRFRDTFATDLLKRGASIYDVAQALGDTEKTVRKHYAKHIPELQERVRSLLSKGTGYGDELSVPLAAAEPALDWHSGAQQEREKPPVSAQDAGIKRGCQPSSTLEPPSPCDVGPGRSCHKPSAAKRDGGVIVHGTRTAYDKGCRCELCRVVRREYMKKYHSLAHTEHGGNHIHGSNTTYDKGCRCEPCRVAHSECLKTYRARRSGARCTISTMTDALPPGVSLPEPPLHI